MTRRRPALIAALTALLVPGLASLAALPSDAEPAAASATADVQTLADPVAGLDDYDARGTTAPTAAQRDAARTLGAVDLRWSRFGTPSSVLPADGSLGDASSGDAVTAARAWLADHASVFGLTAAQVADLELVNDQALADYNGREPAGHAVVFQQRYGDLAPALDGKVTVGVAHGEVAYVSSSITKADGAPPAADLSPVEGWLKAAADVGRSVSAGDVDQVESGDGWTRLTVPGFAQEQQVRLRALALADGTVRPVYEANVVDTEKGAAFAYTVLVDAVSGEVLHRQNQVDNLDDAFTFTGTVTATDCGPRHQFELTDGKTHTIAAVASSLATTDDIVLKLYDPAGQLLASSDTGTSPEAVTYTADSIPAGIYALQVCPYDDPTVPVVVGPYTAVVTTSDQAPPSAGDAAANPKWRYFPANPSLDFSAKTTPSNSVVGCWFPGDGCTEPTGALRNVQAVGPWDTFGTGGLSTMTTTGNNAVTHEAWASPLTPGGTAQAPYSPTREYTTKFTDAWNNSKCDPAQLHPGGNDINAVVTNLFAVHNRMHDFAYYLGFTEDNYNLQGDNFGRGGTGGDPEVGNAQAGALTGGQPTFLGRDNANQITLQDGVPGITNQYLFQPIAGAFYSPCADGDLDMSVVGHEYTHAISNRMVGGPDEGLTSEQGGAMGESWSDLDAMEYLFEHGYSTGTSPYVIGPYATGNRTVGIRDYALDRNPLNYSDYGFDGTGPEVHADGEIWNGTQFEVRRALVRKYDARFPSTDKALNLRCARGRATRSPLPAGLCPGNRRWLQLMFDSFLLQQGATSMLDARDAMLAADRMRFGGRDLKVMWDAFARRGMGRGASTPSADSSEPRPSFASPRSRNGRITFRTGGSGKVFVGDYEARVTPVADTLGGTKLGATASFVPGTYRMLYVSPTRGFRRFTMTVRPGDRRTVTVRAPRNLAAAKSGASVLGSTGGSLNAPALIDGTEGTNWGGVTGGNVDATHPYVAVDLAGGVHEVSRVQVSAMLRPADDTDPDAGSRFTALRRFALEACTSGCSSADAGWRRFYASPADAFPAVSPRPVAPNLTLRSFDVPDTRAAAIRLVVLENQCTGYAGYAGDRDADPTNDTDCKSGSDRGTIVHAAELQVY